MAAGESSCVYISKEVGNNHEKNYLCKQCGRQIVKDNVMCVKCNQIYHPGCLKQANLSKNTKCFHEIDTGVPFSGDSEDNMFYDVVDKLSRSESKIDTVMFLYILKQKDIIIDELREKVKILNVYIDSIKENKQDNKKGQVDNINLEHKKTPDQIKGKQATPKNSCSLPPWTNSHKNIEDDKNTSHVYEQKKKVEQTKKGISVKDVSHGIDQEWKTVRPRKLNTWPIVTGDNNSIGVKGVPKLTTLHVYRKDTQSKIL
ncbi:hypothetical protein JTB14_006180 [Gonioctena quinquepunctata]|nr:hypothetical protein JTB14_006180 [Gonioctena quinquepunctata]